MPFTSTTRDVPAARRSGWWRRLILLTLAALWALIAWWQTNKSLPAGLQLDSPWVPVSARDVTFIADITSADAYGRAVVSHAIFDEELAAIRAAERFIVLDYHLFNSAPSIAGGAAATRPIAAELREALLEQQHRQTQLQILLLIDPVNLGYSAVLSGELEPLRAAGVAIIPVNLDRLRDSNFIYSGLWRLAIGWWQRPAVTTAPGPVDTVEPAPAAPAGSIAGWLRLLNFKSDQRRVLIADDGHDGLVAIVGSADPHAASSANSNTALQIRRNAILPLLQSELAIARFSSSDRQLPARLAAITSASRLTGAAAGGTTVDATTEAKADATPASAATAPDTVIDRARCRILTEGGIRAELLERLGATSSGDSIDIAMLHIADRGIIEALLAAARRHVNVRLILDPNREAYGRPTSGIPNQPAASELVAASDGAIHVRWYRTHGEQFHARLVMVYGAQGLWITAGSATLTRRSLADYDLEANIALELDRRSAPAQQLLSYFETLWSNRAALGIEYTTDFGYFADPSQLHYWLYRLMEGTGLSSF